MDSALTQIIEKLNDYIGNLIDVAGMGDEDKSNLKYHLLEAENILLRNGNDKLHQVVSAVTAAVLSKF